ncbi:uncharacterized protein LOC107484476 [Arachis duranensis]|uniref:Uncharacterized protein LOC107484476 n=1 Tax=Arachis duranensis TaxID=130453 RepID=A0A9C6TLE7_ARADU|nr:uncharacterized protein LOC107484476 [Arachis duranensis]
MSLPFPSLPFRSAARDCIPQERNSFVNFQAKTGVENAELCLVLLDRWILLIKLSDLSNNHIGGPFHSLCCHCEFTDP